MPRAATSVEPTDDQLNLDLRRVSYVHSSFGSICLPRSRVDGRRFLYRYDGAAIEITAGSLYDGQAMQDQVVPYGVSARLIQAYLSTYAVLHKTPEVPLLRNVSSFVSEIRGFTSGGPRGTIGPVVEQLKALAACNMTIGVNLFDARSGKTIARTTKIKYAGTLDSLLVDDGTRCWPQAITLSDEYYHSILEHALPLDLSAVKKVAHSAMAIDILYFLASRFKRLSVTTVLNWNTVRAQFGGQNQDPKSFRRFFIAQLKQVKEAYPDANVEPTAGGLVLRPSPTLLPRRVSTMIPR